MHLPLLTLPFTEATFNALPFVYFGLLALAAVMLVAGVRLLRVPVPAAAAPGVRIDLPPTRSFPPLEEEASRAA